MVLNHRAAVIGADPCVDSRSYAAVIRVLTDGAVRVAIVVSGPRSQMSEERLRGQLSMLVVDAANKAEIQLRTRTNRTDSDT